MLLFFSQCHRQSALGQLRRNRNDSVAADHTDKIQLIPLHAPAGSTLSETAARVGWGASILSLSLYLFLFLSPSLFLSLSLTLAKGQGTLFFSRPCGSTRSMAHGVLVTQRAHAFVRVFFLGRSSSSTTHRKISEPTLGPSSAVPCLFCFLFTSSSFRF